MEVEGRRGGPYATAVELTAEPEPERLEEKAYAAWIRPLADYERREAHEFQMSRYG
jgi:hypothetical protein